MSVALRARVAFSERWPSMGNSMHHTRCSESVDVVIPETTKVEREDSKIVSLFADVAPPLLSLILERVDSMWTLLALERVCRAFYWMSHGKLPPMVENPWRALALRKKRPQLQSREEFFGDHSLHSQEEWFPRYFWRIQMKAFRQKLVADGAKGMSVITGVGMSRWRVGLFRIDGLRNPARVVMLGTSTDSVIVF